MAFAQKSLFFALLLTILETSAFSADVPPVVPAFPHDQTLVPGKLYFRQVDLGRNGHIDWHNGSLYTANVTGTPAREFRFADPSDPSSLYLHGGATVFSEHDTHGHTKAGDFLGRRIKRVGINENVFTNAANGRPQDPQPIPSGAVGGRARQHTIYYPWATPFHWNQYGDSNGWGWIYRDGELLHEWDLLGQTGVLGNTILLGNILFKISHEEANGIVALDISPIFETPSRDPVVLDKLGGSVGAYLAGIWENYIILARRDTNSLDMVDISDPTDLRFVASIPLHRPNSGVPYIQFQDNFGFVAGNKIDMETRQVVLVLDSEDTGTPASGFEPSSAFIPRPAGSASGRLDLSQYNLPLGNLLITGAMGSSDRDGIGVWAHQAEPDTRRPYVGYHIPRPGQTNFPLGAPVSIVIHETLESYTIVNGESIILRKLGETTPIDCYTSFSHDDILTLTPRDYLEPDTTYEVVIVDGGIKDAAGNGIEPYSFTFSTGDTSGGNQSPVINSFLPDITRSAPGATVTFTVNAVDEENDPLEYRYTFGDGTPPTAWTSATSISHTYTAVGRYDAKVQVRDLKPDGGTSLASATLILTVTEPAPELQPTRSGPVVLDPSTRRVYTVNPDNDSVTAVDADTLEVVYEVELGSLLGLSGVTIDPRNLALDGAGRLWITAYGADAIIVLTAETGVLVTAFDFGHGSAPIGILSSPDRQTLFATLEGRGATNPGHGQIVRFSGLAETGRLELGPTPRALAMTSDGNRLLVTRFISAENYGEVWEVNPNAMTLTRTIPLLRDRGDRGFDTGSSGKGVPNYVSGIAISPDNQWAWYTATKPNTQRGAFFRQGTEFNQDLTHDSTVRALVGRISLVSNNEPNVDRWSDQSVASLRIDVDNSDSPSAVTFSPEGDYAFATLQGNNQIAFFDHIRLLETNARVTSWRIPTGPAPQGIVFDPASQRIFAKNFMGRSLTVYDLGNFLNYGLRNTQPLEISTVSAEALPPVVLLGKQIFYHASDQMSFENYISCATCHFDGGHDGRTFDFTQRGEGLRNTTDLRGRAGMAHRNVHWTANFDEIQDFIIDIMEHQLGTGFLPEGESPNPPLGAPNAGRSVELDSLAAYVTSLGSETLPRSPFRNPDGTLTAEAIAGAHHFAAQSCLDCHSPQTAYTDSMTGLFPILHNVGTLRESSGSRLGEPLTGIDTPTLLGIFATAPYFHDGSAETLEEVFVKAGGQRIQAETGILSGNARIRQDMVINMDNSAHGTAVQLRDNGDTVTFNNIDGGPGGLGAIEIRYENTASRTVRLVVNGTIYDQFVPGTSAARQWRRVFFNDVMLTAGNTNQIRFEQINGGYQIDDLTVTTAADRTLAEPHRRVLNMSPQEQAELLAYLLQLDSASTLPPPPPEAPAIITQPLDTAVLAGQDASFSVLATGVPAPTFQWEFRSTTSLSWQTIPNAHQTSLLLPNVTEEDTGFYRVVVTNTEDSVTSLQAELTLLPPPPIPTEGLIAEWLFEENEGNIVLNTINPDYDGSLQGSGVTRTEGVVGQALAFAGGNAQVNVPAFDLSGSAVTFSLFGRVDDLTIGDARFFGKASGLPNNSHTWMLSTLDNNRLRARLRINGTTRELISPDNVFNLGEWHHFAVIYDGSALRILVDGETVASMSVSGPLDQQPANPIAIGNHPGSEDRSLNGAIDQFRIYNRALPENEILSLAGETSDPGPPSLVTFDDWINNLENPPAAHLRGRMDDPDGDGIPNVLEFALGGNPMVAKRSIMPHLHTSENEEGRFLHLTYLRAREGITYTVVMSTTLEPGSWTPVGVDQGMRPVGEYVTATVPMTPEEPRRFLRLLISEE